MMKLISNRNFKILLFILAFILTFGIVFSRQFSTGFEFVIGSRFDGMIETSILQHWYNFFTGQAKWNQVAYFYPYKDTLGYNDGYLIFGIIFSIYKFLGLDVFLASEFVNITLKAIGFISFFYLARHVLKVGFYAAVAGAMIFSLSNSLTVQMHHAQLLSLTFAPLLTALLLKYFSSVIAGDRKNSIILGSCSAVFLSAWLITSFYMAWFYLLFSLIFIICIMPSILFSKALRESLFIRVDIYSFFVPILFFVVSIIPFLLVYLPKAKETGGQNLYSVTYYAPKIGNLLDPGSSNLLFGKLADFVFGSHFGSVQRVGELNVGFPPFIVLVFVFSLLSILFLKKKDVGIKLIAGLIFAVFISLAVMIKQGDFFLWEYIWKFVPGAKGMRVTSRYALFLIFPLALLATLFLSGRIIKIAKPIGLILGVLLITEQVNLSQSSDFNRKASLAFLNDVPVPPKECKSFYVLGQRHDEFDINNTNIVFDLYPHNVDAMFIAEVFHLRTINGFSTFNPKDWDFAKNPLNTYIPRVLKYVDAHGIRQGLCEFDLNRLKWTYFSSSQQPGTSGKVEGNLSLKLRSKIKSASDNSGQTLSVTVINNSDFALGENTFYPLNVGVRLYSLDGTLINQDFLRVAMPYVAAHGGHADVTLKLPEKVSDRSRIQIVPVEEGIAWLDKQGVKPLVVSF